MEPLKDQLYPISFFEDLATYLKKEYPDFSISQYLDEVKISIPTMELKERMDFTAHSFARYLSADFYLNAEILCKIAPHIKNTFAGICFPTYIQHYGLHDFEFSMQKLHFLTRFSSSEFAVRPFILNYPEKALKLMNSWSKDENEHVRRLASEGSRPRLPWAPKLPAIIQDPNLTIEILNQLKKDDSLYVRKSVGNHLNDISKDNKDFVIKQIQDWDLAHPHTKWIVTRALRGLIKAGDAEALKLLGVDSSKNFTLEKFSLSSEEVKIGDEISFAYSIQANEDQLLNLDFEVNFASKNGKSDRKKVFKLGQKELSINDFYTGEKKVSLKEFSTRKIYAGTHSIRLLVNGVFSESLEFKVTE